MSEYLAIALAGFGGEVRYATKPPWTQMLVILDIDLPKKIMDRPQQGPTVFTDASSATSTAAAVWAIGRRMALCQNDRSCDLSPTAGSYSRSAGVQTVPDIQLNIVTDSMFVAQLCLAMSGPGVSTSTTALMLQEALFFPKGHYIGYPRQQP